MWVVLTHIVINAWAILSNSAAGPLHYPISILFLAYALITSISSRPLFDTSHLETFLNVYIKTHHEAPPQLS